MHPRLLLLACVVALTACAGLSEDRRSPPALAPSVDLSRFMGDWYVIANIPTPFEKGAHNAVESYRMDADGSIPVVFTFNLDAFDGPVKRYDSRAFVQDDPSNAVWGVQFVWPFRADYRISYVSADYSQTVITRSKRDYVWIMARTPTIPAEDLARLSAFVASQGYDPAKLRQVPQQRR
jgi:apolipoprotein D and lipocalin family protein